MPAAIPIAIAAGSAATAGASIYASKQQQKAAKSAQALQERMYNQGRADNMPYIQGGYGALGALQGSLGLGGPTASGSAATQGTAGGGGYSDLIMNNPIYDFLRSEGTRGINNASSAQGTLLTGGTLKALNRFNLGLASTFDDKYYNRFMDLARMGQNAASGAADRGSSYANNAGDTMLQGANAAPAGTVGAANAGINGLNQYLNYRYGQQSAYPPYTNF